MDDLFLEYLLGSLDAVTAARVQTYLDANSAARERLALLERALAPLDTDADTSEPPPGLVIRTLSRVAEYHALLPAAPAPPRNQVGAPPRRFLRRIDWLVAAVLLLLVGGLAFPFLAEQWRDYQRVACNNNLRQFWHALASYADGRDGDFPKLEPAGARSYAGIFVPILQDSGVLQNVTVCCPSQPQLPTQRYTVAELEELRRTRPDEFGRVAGQLAGHYAYCLGYTHGDRLEGLRRDSGDLLPVIADRSTAAGGNSENHAGAGQNVLFLGGNARWCVQPTVGVGLDNIYVNRFNHVGAGVGITDSVLGKSDARPLPRE